MIGREWRRVPALLLVSLLAVTLLTGCLGLDRAGSSVVAPAASGDPAKSGTADGVPESTVGTSHISGDLDRAAGATSNVPFVEKAEESGGSGYDADTMLSVRHGHHGDYERAVIDLGTGEEPAGTVPEWILTSSGGDGLLRVDLPSVNATCVSGGKFGEGLVESFHVVRAPDGGMFVDFFAHKPFRYRVLGMQDPARLVVDFEPAEGDLGVPPPAQGDDTVLLEPRPDTRVSNPLTVSGYSRNPKNTITLTGSHGKTLVRRTVESNDWNHTWGYFEATIDLPPFSGKGALKVGTGNTSDGAFEGVELPLRGS